MLLRYKSLESILKEILIACVGGGVLFGLIVGVQRTIQWKRSAQSGNELHIGNLISNRLQRAVTDRRVLLIATSASCSYSRNSVGFHRSLVTGAEAVGLTIIVAVPDKRSMEFARREFGLPAHNLIVTSLSSLGIRGTPTIAVIGPDHRVQHLWSGALPPSLQEVILSQVLSSRHILSKPNRSEVSDWTSKGLSRVKSEVSSGMIVEKPTDEELAVRLEKANVVDISPRDVFARTGRRQSINIPFDELSVRSRYELDKLSPWVVDCSHVDASNCDLETYLLEKSGFNSVLILDRGATGISCQTTPTE